MTEQEEICQTIINEKTGEICGHEYTFHDVLDNEACHLMDCPCKKFKPKNPSRSDKNRRKRFRLQISNSKEKKLR